jgi:hypothetical protein
VQISRAARALLCYVKPLTSLGRRKGRLGLTRWVCGSALDRQTIGAGGAASASGGEARDLSSPRGGGNKRVRTSTSISDTACPPRPLIVAQHASHTGSMSAAELMEHLLSFVEGRLWAHTPSADQCGHHTPFCAGEGLAASPPPKPVPAPLSWGGPPPVMGGAMASGPMDLSAHSTSSAITKPYPWTAPPERKGPKGESGRRRQVG